jgi:hypothetical protein
MIQSLPPVLPVPPWGESQPTQIIVIAKIKNLIARS